MKKLLHHFLLLFIFSGSAHAIEPVYSTILAKDTRSWDDGQFEYPEGTAQIIVQKITITPGDEDFYLSEHCHPIPLAAYVLSGSVHVAERTGQYHIFSAGHAFIEVMNTWHRGKFLEKTELIAFYAASEGTPLSVKTDDTSGFAERCN